ncbi:MAG: DNA polymerase III subunit beta [Deltaproteobacteria bacterium RIFCSPLOWO2_12_FULL_40_28]|nr:MAG: DNA polymerase III subunit beta [Deltaproteobacteria bacterium RIFCSPHIGHO2_02_FULL_40_28]OGQ20748.1 MAG: DNA polymerase III subunit beta [Deltaproteobacteria bacterium RIFCSPHIGHO2_12_FULL_40_32]OGQ41296.1 MAG: DNA polymerase III subunit beta [Deltaproteobacteria bacterium RIFCSPLOWO2_02_FULL_40_36]OGQ55360.1 MAG: DNA polymerase III subunit beta [Deltaproteobacteria bacterium RIFCSPLOWO2_12_FULL_40_28]
MEFKIGRDQFLEGLAKAQGVVERKNTMPVLSNILIEADKSNIKLTATDLEVAYVSKIPAHVIQTGQATLPCRNLHDIVREMNLTDIHLSLKENNRVEIKGGTSQFNIPSLPATEFPSLPQVEGESVELSCSVIANMIEKTAFAMSVDETRHHLAGILLEKGDGDTFRMVATDGHRLALIDQDVSVEKLKSVRVIIPKKGVGELRKLVSKEGSFELALGDKNLCARKGNESLYIRLIEGDFPDYNRVIPKKSEKIATLPRTKFIGALRRVSLLANERSRGIVVSLSSGMVEISINNPDLGEAREEFDMDYRGENVKIGFNAKYFLDGLDVIKDDTVTLSFQGDLAPCILRAHTKDPGFLYVIMPMRI